MDLAEAREEIRERLSEYSPNYWEDSQLDRHINASGKRFMGEEAWNWAVRRQVNVSLAAGQVELELIDEIDATRQFNVRLKLTSAPTRMYIPERVGPSYGWSLELQYTDPGVPRFYYLNRTARADRGVPPAVDFKNVPVVVFVPLPNVEFTVDYMYYTDWVTLVLDTDEMVIPEKYTDAIVSRATGMAWLKEQNGMADSKAQQQFNMYLDTLEQAKKANEFSPPDRKLAAGAQPDRYRHRGVRARLPDWVGP